MTTMTAVVVSPLAVIPVVLPALTLMTDPGIPVPMIARIQEIGTTPVARIATVVIPQIATAAQTAREPRIATVVIPQIATAAQTAKEPPIAMEVIHPTPMEILLRIGTAEILPETVMETRTDIPIAMEIIILRIVMEIIIIIQTGMIGEILERIRVPGITKIRVMPKRNLLPPLRFLRISFLGMNEMIMHGALRLRIVLLALNQYLLHNIITEMNLK
jgi:hypothetical protein